MNEEFRAAAGALLMSPLLHADSGTPDAQADSLRLVRKHRRALEDFFSAELGYRLVVERRAARLVKLDPGAEPPRPLIRGTTKRPMTPRGYACLCLVLAALGSGRRQWLLDELVREVRATAAQAGLELDLETATDRRALHAAVVVLTEWGVLRERDGDLARWAEDTRAQSLLDADLERTALVLTGMPRIGSIEDLLTPDALPTSVGGARLATRRRLVESPLLDVSELSDDQREWWVKSRRGEESWYEDRLGLRLEIRAEGALAIDPDDELSDVTFPGVGSARHLALLVLERVVAGARDRRAPRVEVPLVEVERAFTTVVADHPQALIAAYREDGARLRADVAEVLRATGLVHLTPDGAWQVHAAAARFAPRVATASPTLFEET